MAQPLSTQGIPAAARLARNSVPAIAMAGAGLGAVVLLGALLLWLHYGTAVFFEMVAAGISACF